MARRTKTYAPTPQECNSVVCIPREGWRVVDVGWGQYHRWALQRFNDRAQLWQGKGVAYRRLEIESLVAIMVPDADPEALEILFDLPDHIDDA